MINEFTVHISSFLGKGLISLLHNVSTNQLSYQNFVLQPLTMIFLMHELQRERVFYIPLHIKDREVFFLLGLAQILQGGFKSFVYFPNLAKDKGFVVRASFPNTQAS